MNFKYKSLFKDTIIFAIGSLGSKVILFVLVPIYTNFLTTEEYGMADLVSTCASLIIPITSLTISNALLRFGMKINEKSENVLFDSFVVIFLSVLVTLLLTPFFGLYKPIGDWKWYLCFQVIFTNINEVERTYLKVKNNNKLFSVISIIHTFVLAGMNILLLTILKLGIRGYLYSNIIAQGFCVIITFFAGKLYNDLKNGQFNRTLLKKMVMYSSPLIFSNISWWVIHSSDKIMIEGMITASALGIYTAATKIPSLINVLISIFNQAWGISSIKEIETTSDTSFFDSVFDLYSTVMFGACMLFITFIKPFMNIYVGKSFSDAWMYTPLLLTAAVFYAITAFIGSLYSALQKTKNDMWTIILCAFLNVIINYCGIKVLGTWGAIVGTVTAYFVCAMVRVFDIKRLMSIRIPLSYWINSFLLFFHAIAISIQWNPILVSIVSIILFIVINYKELCTILMKFACVIKREG